MDPSKKEKLISIHYKGNLNFENKISKYKHLLFKKKSGHELFECFLFKKKTKL